jgi:cytoskeletal protein CcmA (bactofilin family)
VSKILFDNYKQALVAMSNQPTPSVFIEMAFNSNAFFQGSQKGDVCIRTAQPSQSILFGTQINQPAIFGIDGSNIIMRGNIAIGGQTSNPLEALDIRNGNAYFDSNVYVMNKLCVGGTNPDGALHVTNGDTKLNSNLYVIGTASIGISSSNPTETLDVNSNLKVRSNAYVMHRVGVANSNPTEALDITGNIKVTNNIYSMSNIGVGTSNPTERLDVQQNAMVRSNAYVLRRLAVGGSNPTEALDVSGNGKITGNMFVSSAVGIGNTNPTEALDVNVNLKVRSNAYITHRVGVGTSNPTETVDVIGNTKVSANIYALNAVGVGTTNPSEKVDIVGNAKVQSNMYVVNRIGVGVSNPTERVDVAGNVYASGSIYSMTNIGVGTVLPGERIEATGNIKSLSNVYVMNRVAVGHSNPTERVDVTGNVKVSSNMYISHRVGINTTSPLVGLEVNTTDSILLPKGTTAQRPAPAVLGHVRYNTETSQFEGFGAGSSWGSLGGVKSTNQQTYISAEEYPGSNDDNIRFINSNIETMRITREGNVGIGTSNPETILDVNGLFRFKDPNRGNYITFHSNDNWDGVQMNLSMTGNDIAIGVDPNNFETVGFVRTLGRMPLTFGPNGMERMRIDHSSGYVGINTTTPFYNLDVNGSINAIGYCNLLVDSTSSESTSNAPTANALKLAADAAFFTSNALFLGAGGGSTSVATVATAASNTAFWSSNNLVKKSGDTMTGSLDVTGNIKSTSNVYVMSRLGVNTSNPSQAVHVVGNMRLEGNLDVNGIFNTINTDVQVTDQFTVSNNGTGPALKVHQMGAQAIADFFDDSNIAMRIADGGNVGIGTNAPSFKLDVQGLARFGSNVGQGSGSPLLQLQNGTSNLAFFANLPQGNFNSCIATGDYAILAGMNSINTGSLTLGNWGESNAGIRIDKTGNIGVGTNSPSYRLDVNGAMRSVGIIQTSYTSTFTITANGVRDFVTLASTSGTLQLQIGLSTSGGNTTMSKLYCFSIAWNLTANTWQRCIPQNAANNNTDDYELQMRVSNNTTTLRVVHANNNIASQVTMNITCFYPQNDVPTLTSLVANAEYTDASYATYSFVSTSSITQTGGNVGIGTSTPSQRLDVNGTVNATAYTGATITSLSNLGLFGSNTSLWSSNNLLNRNTGGIINGTLSNLGLMTVRGTASPGSSLFSSMTFTNPSGGYGGLRIDHTSSYGSTNFLNASDDPVNVLTNGVSRFIIKKDTGFVGVNTDNPTANLEVNGSMRVSDLVLPSSLNIIGSGWQWSNSAWRAFNANGGYVFRNGDAGGLEIYTGRSNNGANLQAVMTSNGNLGLGTASPSVRLHVDGEILATNDITAFSDITAKSNLQLITTPLDKVSKLNGYTYDMNQEKPSTSKITTRYTGVIAQELEKVLPEAVHKDPNGKLSVAYGNMAGLFIECIKELTSQNKQLAQENQDLKSQLQALATKVADIEKVIPLSH